MLDRYKLSETLIQDLKCKAENPPTRNYECLKVLPSTFLEDNFEEYTDCAEHNKQ